MGRIRALPLLGAVLAAALLVSGASGADPRTPAALPGHAAPFLGTSVVGDGGLLAAIDDYGDVVDLRSPGPAGEAQIVNPFARQAAGSVPADTGIVASATASGSAPQPLWKAARLDQGYLRGSNVLRTRARVGGARVAIEDTASGQRLARRIVARAAPGKRLVLRLELNLDLAGTVAGDAIAPTAAGFRQRDGSRVARCRVTPRPTASAVRVGDAAERLRWSGRGLLRVSISCGFGARPLPAQSLTSTSVARDREWLAARRPLGPRAPAWAQRMYSRSLLVLRALTDRRSGAAAAAARDHWAYVWPRDAGTVAIALAAGGYRAEAGRVARFLARLDLDSGARFRGDGSPVSDGRALPGDAAGWVAAAAKATGIRASRSLDSDWRGRGDYGERDGDSGDYLANAIASGVPAIEIRRLFASDSGLVRRAGNPGSGLDSAAAWAVRPFPRRSLFPLVRPSLLSIDSGAGRFGLVPSQDWPRREAWTAPAAWSAWSLAALGEREAALRLLAAVRRAATPSGTIPERVAPRTGQPRSATPLGWSHALVLLALRQLYP